MNLKKLIISSLLLAIGYVLHQVAPPILFGMKPDFLLTMMFIAILVADDYKSVLAISIAAGLITAVVTTFPGGQIPNIIDKLITGQIVYGLHKILGYTINTQIKTAIISIIGTLVSGCAFLGSALLMFGLPAPFAALILTVVLPTAIINCFSMIVLYKAVNMAVKGVRA